MIRISQRTCRADETSRATAKEFFEACARDLPAPWILLVGSVSLQATRIRLAQSTVRLDERPSLWSHAALVLDLDPSDVLASTGAEVRIAPPDSTGPERSYVSFFRLGDYADDEAHPCLAVVSLEARADASDAPRSGQRAGAGGPLGDRIRTHALGSHPRRNDRPMGALLAAWSAHAFDPARFPNPLLANMPLPCAAYLDYVFSSSGVDWVPAAATPAVTPEHLWATLRYYDHPSLHYHYRTRRLDSGVRMTAVFEADLEHAYRDFRDPT